ncbi:MAG: GIY-YIG nuclease family protein [Bacteroidia bacterium]
MKAVVYIIYSERLNKFYIGKSENYAQRIKNHNSDGNENWSKVGRPWQDFVIISCVNFKQAGKIENYIKAQKSKKYLISLKEKPAYINNLLERFAQGC